MSETVDLNQNQNQNEKAAEELLASFSPKSTQDAASFLKQQNEETKKEEDKSNPPSRDLHNSDASAKNQESDETKQNDQTPKDEGQKKSKGEKEDFETLYSKLLKESEVKEKLAEDNKRHARQLARNVSIIKQHIKELQESGDIDEETAKSLFDVASKNVDPDKILTPENKGDKEKLSPHVAGLEELINKGKDILEKYLEFAPNSEQENNHAAGFDFQLSLISDQERQDIFEKLKKYNDSPKELLKTMLEIGRDFWDSMLGKGIKEHGNLIGIIDAQSSTIEELNNKIAKLEKNSKKETEKEERLKNSHTPSPVRKFSQYSPEEMLKREWAGNV